ncbi:MAG: rubredoxin [Thermodesulfobacteriota bacterium]
MQQYECGYCGYIYDPCQGGPGSDIPPNTAFENLPEDWFCPICGAFKEAFKPV